MKQTMPLQSRIELNSTQLTKLEDTINLIENYATKHEIEYKTRQSMPSTIYRIEFDTQHSDMYFRGYICEVMQIHGGCSFDKTTTEENIVTTFYTLNICQKK